MRVTVDVAGEETHVVDLDSLTDGDDAVDGSGSTEAVDPPTYADLVGAIEYSPHEVSVLVDGRLVPEDQPVDADEVTVLRLIKGG